MTADPQDQAFNVPTSADASRILEEITSVTRRSRRLARDVALARPLLAWGLVAVAAPSSTRVLTVFLASLWAVGMLLYGIGVQDTPLAVIGLVIVMVAAATRIAAPGAAVLAVGLTGGAGMAALGGWRMRWRSQLGRQAQPGPPQPAPPQAAPPAQPGQREMWWPR